ncbi:antA/AntB antirepressor family protein [Corynebacterium sp.]|uniref:antA/AntB antirepressor family protein n=1 Tax=Corynebacterium sp. TaxID=1720 RepID=UPI0028A62F17|nr:antA/AntB antirepressor family protein [Corynebacterium sp.]
MSELIPIHEQDGGRQAVMGRDLHRFLEVTTRYNDWIARLVEKYGFEESTDYVLKNEYVTGANGRKYEQASHILSMDMAKEVSMVQNNDKGRQARRYFIECERRAQTGEMSELDEAKLVQRALQVTYRQVKELEAINAEMAPKANYVDTFVADEDLVQVRTVANQLSLSEKSLRELLIEKKWIYRISGKHWSNKRQQVVTTNQYRPYAEKRQYFRLVPCHEAPRINGEVQQTLKLTPQGAERVAVAVKRWGNIQTGIELGSAEEDS